MVREAIGIVLAVAVLGVLAVSVAGMNRMSAAVREQRAKIERIADGREVTTDPMTGLATFESDAKTDFVGHSQPFGEFTSPLETFRSDSGETFVDINP